MIIIKLCSPGDSNPHSYLKTISWLNADCKHSTTGSSKIASSLKITRPQWNNIRVMQKSEINIQDKPLWYLPHHPVLNKPGKTRVVLDCATKHKGMSLNYQLLTGPDLTNSVVGALMRFREEKVALSADIKCMFHQIQVVPDDRDAFRFRWWQDGDLTQQPVDLCMEVHLFGATWSLTW